MKKDMKIGFVGGDLRQIFCAIEFALLGFEVALYGFEKYTDDIGLCTRSTCLDDTLEKADIIVLPIPSTSDGVNINTPYSDKCIRLCQVLDSARDCKLLLYGTGSKTEQLCRDFGINAVDFSKREDYQILNAGPTAEGALAIAINEMPKTIFDSTALCVGYGRIGKTLCRMLQSLGADVYASARNPRDIALAKSTGLKTVHTDNIPSVLPKCNLIFNTVPKTIIKDYSLDVIDKNALIIDLASKPGGIDFKTAKQKGLNVIWALSIPGKTSPLSAGKILCDTIMEIMRENGLV